MVLIHVASVWRKKICRDWTAVHVYSRCTIRSTQEHAREYRYDREYKGAAIAKALFSEIYYGGCTTAVVHVLVLFLIE